MNSIRNAQILAFFARTMPVTETGCAIWLGAVGTRKHHGYGKAWDALLKKNVLAHRLAWELMKGQVPDGMLVLHKCDVRCCVNPDHLYIGTYADNVHDVDKRGRRNKWKETCKRGHPRTPENTVEYKTGGRHCRLCRNISASQSYIRFGKERRQYLKQQEKPP